MKFIDFHCDTLYRMIHVEDVECGETLEKNKGHIDLERLNKSGTLAQCFACFLNIKNKAVGKSHYRDVHTMIDILEEACEKDDRYLICDNNIGEWIQKLDKADKTACIITLEEGGVLEGDITRLVELYNRGVRIITLTWNHENCIGYPNYAFKYSSKGLKEFGLKVINEMDKLGMVIDVSHLSDAGFWDVANNTCRPFIATHSNARTLMEHPRNLTDDMIRAIAKSGGVIGLNYYGAFLQEDGKCTFDILCKHIEHITTVGGQEILCLGSDFDGIDCELPMSGCQDLNKFADAMRKYGFDEENIEKYCFKNAIEFFERFERNI